MKTSNRIGFALLLLSSLSFAPGARAEGDGHCEENRLQKYYFCSKKCGDTGYAVSRALVSNLYDSRGRLIHTSCRVMKTEEACYETADSLNSKQ